MRSLMTKRRFRRLLRRRLGIHNGNAGLLGKYGENDISFIVGRQGIVLSVHRAERQAPTVIRDLLIFAEVVARQTGYDYVVEEPPFFAKEDRAFQLFFRRQPKESASALPTVLEPVRHCMKSMLSLVLTVLLAILEHPKLTMAVLLAILALGVSWMGGIDPRPEEPAGTSGDILVGLNYALLALALILLVAVFLLGFALYGNAPMADWLMRQRHRQHDQEVIARARQRKKPSQRPEPSRQELLDEMIDDRSQRRSPRRKR